MVYGHLFRRILLYPLIEGFTESIVSDHMVSRRFRELGKETLRNIRRTQIFLVEIKSDITCLALVLYGT